MSKQRTPLRMAADEIEILIFEDIGSAFFGGLSAKAVVDQLNANKAATSVRVRINSSGGSVFEAIAIYNALKNHGGRVVVEIEGVALSAASMIAMAGDEIRAAENAMLMIHEPNDMAMGTPADLRASADRLEKVRVNIVKIYAERSGIPEARISLLMADETWFTAAEAVEAGLVDQVTATRAVAAHVDLERFQAVPEWARKRIAIQARGATSPDRSSPMSKSKAAKRAKAPTAQEPSEQAPIGTCVLPDGTMEQVTAASCEALGGNWAPQAAPAAQEPEEGPMGACALPDGTTEQLSESACSARDGTWSASAEESPSGSEPTAKASDQPAAPLATAKDLKALGAGNDFIVECLEKEMTLANCRDALIMRQGQTIRDMEAKMRIGDPHALKLDASGSGDDGDAEDGDPDDARHIAEWRRNRVSLKAEGFRSEKQYTAAMRAIDGGHARVLTNEKG